MTNVSIRLYSLTTCAYHQAIKKMFANLNVPHEAIDADLFSGTDREAMLAELRAINLS